MIIGMDGKPIAKDPKEDAQLHAQLAMFYRMNYAIPTEPGAYECKNEACPREDPVTLAEVGMIVRRSTLDRESFTLSLRCPECGSEIEFIPGCKPQTRTFPRPPQH